MRHSKETFPHQSDMLHNREVLPKVDYDKWLFVLHNLSRLMERPAALHERVFASLFRQAEIDKMQPNERRQYEKSLFDYNDINT